MTDVEKRAEIEENIRQLEALKASGVMPAELADASIAALKEKLATYEAILDGDGALAQGEYAVAVGKQGIYVGGNFTGNIYQGEDPKEDEKRLDVYRRWVRQLTSSLPLRGVDVGASDPTRAQEAIGLANVYVDLDTTYKKQELTDKRERQTSGGRIVSGWEVDETISVIEAVIQNRSLVLLGDPGSGKSTFVNFLAHCLAAHALEPDRGWLKHLNGWPENETDLLPVPVTLRDFARYYSEKLPKQAEPHHLLDFIKMRLEDQNMGFALKPLVALLDSGRAIVLLDGLDEVPTQAQRIFVRDAVQAFMHRHDKSRYLLTCRVLSYQEPEPGKPDLRLSGLPNFTIAPFDEDKIARFISAWYSELARLGTVQSVDVAPMTARLREAVRRPDLERLAPNPLLLTVMALVHTHKNRLPDARAQLYEETVEILLWRWEQIKLGGQEDAPRLRQLLLEAGRGDVDLKRILWELAYEAQAASKPTADGGALADILEHRIIKALAALKCDDDNPEGDLNWAKRVVDLMKVRAGLLLERQPGVFTFPHRTFQEYLAGAHLAAQTDLPQVADRLATDNPTLWWEVIRYAAGKLVYVNGDVSRPLSMVAELCPEDVEDTYAGWKKVWIAGDALLDIGLKRARDSALGRSLLRQVQGKLVELIEGGKLTSKERVFSADTLATLGDPRFDPNHWQLPFGETLGFVHIPADEFIMGGKGKYDGKPQHKLTLPEYWMAKYPVTVAQFRVFSDEAKYKKFDERVLRDPDNRPVRYVTWHDAMVYCEWLQEQLLVVSGQLAVDGNPFWQGIKAGTLRVTLPSEAEWEKAARGPSTGSEDGRAYPWGEGIDENKANYYETGINDTSAVGCFLDGASPYGLFDMSGNVWEWTRSIYGDYPYPEFGKALKERENLKAGNDKVRVLRGGAFINNVGYLRCAYRDGNNPAFRSNDIGFRVMVSCGA